MTVQCRAVAAINLHFAHKTVEISGDCEEVRRRLAELIAIESALVGEEAKKLGSLVRGKVPDFLKIKTGQLSWLKRMLRWRPRGP